VASSLLTNDLLLAQNVPPKAVPGVVQDATPAPAASSSPASSLGGLLPLVMMAVVLGPMLLLMSRRQKKEAQARASLKRGDRVLTNSGLIGELVELDDRVAKVKIAAGTTVEFVSNTVSPYVEPQKAPAKDLKAAKAVPDKK
jgi:preprotein translocase subunit YajC